MKLEQLDKYLEFDWEDYDYFIDLIENDRNEDNSNELDKLLEKVHKLFELYKNDYYLE